MPEKKITLNELIQVANKNSGTDKETLKDIIDEGKIQGTVPEVIQFVDENESLFSDPNLAEVKKALQSFLGKMPPQKLQSTLASMIREMNKLYPEKKSQGNGDGILSQSDLDSLLAQSSKPDKPRKPKIVTPIPEEQDMSETEHGEEDFSTLDQSDIDELLSQQNQKPEPSKAELDEKADAGKEIDQNFIDSLLENRSTKSDDGDPEPPEDSSVDADPVMDRSSIDGLLAEAGSDIDQSSIDKLLAEAGSDMDQSSIDELMAGANSDIISSKPAGTENKPSDDADTNPDGIEDNKSTTLETNFQEQESNQATANAPSGEKVSNRANENDTRQQVSTSSKKVQPAPHGDAAAEIALPRILEEKGESKILKEFYRIYIRENGSFRCHLETEEKFSAREEVQKILEDYPAKNIAIRKIIQKEVLVIKEDNTEIPIALKIDLGE